MRHILALAALLAPGIAAAQTSFYTELRGETCTMTQTHHEFQCQAPPGFGARINVGGRLEVLTIQIGQRRFVAAPPQGQQMPGQAGAGDRIEWRTDRPRGAPYALIMHRTEDRRSRLEVYRVGASALCWVGVAENNERARAMADQARNNACG